MTKHRVDFSQSSPLMDLKWDSLSTNHICFINIDRILNERSNQTRCTRNTSTRCCRVAAMRRDGFALCGRDTREIDQVRSLLAL